MRGKGKTLSLFLIIILTLSSAPALFLVVPAEGQGGQFSIAPPSVQFSIADGSVLYNVGNFNVAFVASGCTSNDVIMAAYLRSVSYRTSWQNYDIEVLGSGQKSNLDPNGFFCTVDLSHVPLGAQQITVTVTSESDIFSIFTKTSQTAIHFNITAPPQNATVPPASTWNVNKVAENIADTTNFPVAVDSNGIPQIAYTGFGVEYAKWNGFSWSTQTVDVGSVDSLALGADGMPRILYWGWGDSGLKYACWTGSNWTTQIIDPSINGYYEVGALALDSSGNPHVAYINGTTVQYASWTGSNWTKQIVETYPEIRAPISLALDSSNNPQILYDCPTFIADNGLVGTDENQMGLHSFYTYYHFRLASWNGTTWSIQNITYANDPESSLVLDSKNNPHIVYKVDHSFENSTLMYDSWNGTTWNSQEVISNVSLFNTGFLRWTPTITHTLSTLGKMGRCSTLF